jgi:hypothetical protein
MEFLIIFWNGFNRATPVVIHFRVDHDNEKTSILYICMLLNISYSTYYYLLFFHLKKGKENMFGNNIFMFQVDEIELTFVWVLLILQCASLCCKGSSCKCNRKSHRNSFWEAVWRSHMWCSTHSTEQILQSIDYGADTIHRNASHLTGNFCQCPHCQQISHSINTIMP